MIDLIIQGVRLRTDIDTRREGKRQRKEKGAEAEAEARRGIHLSLWRHCGTGTERKVKLGKETGKEPGAVARLPEEEKIATRAAAVRYSAAIPLSRTHSD